MCVVICQRECSRCWDVFLMLFFCHLTMLFEFFFFFSKQRRKSTLSSIHWIWILNFEFWMEIDYLEGMRSSSVAWNNVILPSWRYNSFRIHSLRTKFESSPEAFASRILENSGRPFLDGILKWTSQLVWLERSSITDSFIFFFVECFSESTCNWSNYDVFLTKNKLSQ